MYRLVLFSLTLVGLVLVMNLSGYQSIEVNNDKYNFEDAKKAHAAHVVEVAELAKKHAEVTAPPKVTDEVIEEKTLIPLDTPQLVRADKLYKQCIACHAKDGSGKAANKAPRIGGQMEWYIEKQLLDMKSGARVNQQMLTIVKKLSADDIADLAAYLSKVPWGGVKN
ncbi:c-type cytochrome [Halobacteriovorax sp. HFRX-2_2]|uniref:c-type cytochrome n=1 Tax=unclassified Halobacteriovorax TaxID=2639665 RepID=UPI003722C273